MHNEVNQGNEAMGGSHVGLERRLRNEGVGEVQFDAFARGRYATDASAYQIMPVGVVVPGSMEQATRALTPRAIRENPDACRAAAAPRKAARRSTRRWSSIAPNASTALLSLDTRRAAARSSPALCSTNSTGG